MGPYLSPSPSGSIHLFRVPRWPALSMYLFSPAGPIIFPKFFPSLLWVILVNSQLIVARCLGLGQRWDEINM